MKKIIATLLSLVLLSLPLVTACAVTEDYLVPEETELPYQYTSLIKSTISISSKTATCKSTISASSSVSKIVITQKLQKKSGDEWTTVTSWSETVSSSAAIYKNSKGSLSSGTYRTRTVAKVYKGSDYETVTNNSSSATVS
jgi:hypothetical protein